VTDGTFGRQRRRAENAVVESARVEHAGVDSMGGKCRSYNAWKAVRRENYTIPVV